MKTQIIIVLLAITLAACAPAVTPAPTGTPIPTATSLPTSLPTSTLIPATIIPTPLPTQPTIPIFTPDTIQVGRWKEYQTELAKSILSFLPPEEVLCEWEVLGRSDQEVYVWAVCEGRGSSGSMPAVISLKADGTVQNVTITSNIPESYGDALLKLFPVNVREKFDYYNHGRASEMSEHLEWRRTHPEKPPLIVLSVTPTP